MTRWYSERKQEHYYKKAKSVGYRSRSAFKLKQLQQKFHLIRKNDVVLDLGAAPGGWSQVATELVGPQGKVIGIDVTPIKPLDNAVFITSDITNPETISYLQDLLGEKKINTILSDMSPDISGNYSVDQARSLWLCEKAFDIATQFLNKGGNFVCKIFEGEDTKEFIEKIKHRFYIVKITSPKASRQSSSEIYLIAKAYKQ